MAESQGKSDIETGSCNHGKPKSLLTAYLLWFPLGLVGFHRFYLGYRLMGYIYMFSLGYCGIGWLVDGFAMPSMVKETNELLETEASSKSPVIDTGCEVWWRYARDMRRRNLRDAWILALNPVGFFGVHQQYLGRGLYRIPYGLTAGLFLIGWITDIFRMPSLVKQCNAEIDILRSGVSMEEMKTQDVWDCKTSEAYILGITIGIFGGHQFYLGRYKWGVLYMFTLGFLFIGVIRDLTRMGTLVQESNKARKTANS